MTGAPVPVVPLAPQQHAQAVDAEYWSQLSD